MTEYVQIQPSSFKSVYLPNDNIDFNLTFVNKSIVRNSVRLSGVLKVKNDGEDIQYEKVYFSFAIIVFSCM